MKIINVRINFLFIYITIYLNLSKTMAHTYYLPNDKYICKSIDHFNTNRMVYKRKHNKECKANSLTQGRGFWGWWSSWLRWFLCLFLRQGYFYSGLLTAPLLHLLYFLGRRWQREIQILFCSWNKKVRNEQQKIIDIVCNIHY